MPSLAIVGAGAAGCAAAWGLRSTGIQIDLFEKSRGFSGRAATRRRNGCCYDHGANYITPGSGRVEQLIGEALPSDALAAIERPVWTFDGAGTLSEGDPERGGRKWTYRDGINRIGKLLVEESKAEVHLSTPVDRLVHTEEGWLVGTAGFQRYGPYDAVLVTPPAPQAADLIASSLFRGPARDALEEGLRAVRYRSQFSCVLGFDRRWERPHPFFGAVNADGEHAIAWLSFESDKPGHVPEGEQVLVVQMSPQWTEAHFTASREHLAAEAFAEANRLLGGDLPAPAWFDVQRWRYALPEGKVERASLEPAEQMRIYLAGDAVAGQGRVATALENGLAVADALKGDLFA